MPSQISVASLYRTFAYLFFSSPLPPAAWQGGLWPGRPFQHGLSIFSLTWWMQALELPRHGKSRVRARAPCDSLNRFLRAIELIYLLAAFDGRRIAHCVLALGRAPLVKSSNPEPRTGHLLPSVGGRDPGRPVPLRRALLWRSPRPSETGGFESSSHCSTHKQEAFCTFLKTLVSSRARQNAIANLGGLIGSNLCVFIFLPLYLPLLGKEAYGLVGLFSTLNVLFNLVDAAVGAGATVRLRVRARPFAPPGSTSSCGLSSWFTSWPLCSEGPC